MAESKKTFRLDSDIASRLRGEKSQTDIVNIALRQYYFMKDEGIRMPKEDDTVEVKEAKVALSPSMEKVGRRSTYPWDRFSIPVGNITWGIMGGHDHLPVYNRPQGWKVDLWWCPKDKVHELTRLAEHWEGFRLFEGMEENVDEDDLKPEVILYETQQRGRNLRFCPSHNGTPALLNDRLVWLEVTDVAKAYEFINTSEKLSAYRIPCPVKVDVIQYYEDELYRKTVDKANQLFIKQYLDSCKK